LLTTPFQRHDREFMDFQYCYPVISRRSQGLSLGINLSRRKECNFDCPYCQIDRDDLKKNTNEIDLEILKKEILSLITSALSEELFLHPRFEGTEEYYKILRDISLSGDGEPTTSKYFMEVSEIVLRIIREYRDKEILIKPVVITNGSMLHKEAISNILIEMKSLEGGAWVKLDAGTEEEFQMVADSKIPYTTIINNILQFSKKSPITLQTILYYDKYGNESFSTQNMINRLQDLLSKGSQIEYIQLYTLARSTKIKELKPVPKPRLEEVKALIHKETKLNIGVYP
jgi:wyosine [tRNA(Phe)-imidazoG37] synthetase (radical SAM superfamily)